MQILLKQVEINDALKQYIVKLGFSLAGKTVEIDFTAGRKDSGLSADISIEEADIPGVELMEPAAEVVKPALSVVKTEPVAETKTEEPLFDGGVPATLVIKADEATKTVRTSLFS